MGPQIPSDTNWSHLKPKLMSTLHNRLKNDPTDVGKVINSNACVIGAANLRGSFWLKAELTGLDLSQALMDGAQFDGCTFNDIVWPATLPGMLRLHDCRGDLP